MTQEDKAQQIKFKRGDTVMLGCTAFEPTGAPADLLLVEVRAQVRTLKDGDPVVADMVVEWVDRAQGSFELWAPGDALATNWPLGNLLIDVQYSQPLGSRTLRRSSETFYLFIAQDVTK